MEWIQEKVWRNGQLFRIRRSHLGRTACIIMPPPPYPCRPASEYRFQMIGGFKQHPNSTEAV